MVTALVVATLTLTSSSSTPTGLVSRLRLVTGPCHSHAAVILTRYDDRGLLTRSGDCPDPTMERQ